MNSFKNRTLTQRVQLRIRILWSVVILMLVYMVAIGELGLGDSRMMSRLAENVSRMIFFGGLAYVAGQIWYNKKLLANKALLLERQRMADDERRQYLHDKSGGPVVDILLLLLLFATCTTALWNMPAFYVTLGILAAAIALKCGCYLLYNRLS